MKQKYIILLATTLFVLSGCSTKKNTWFSRNYHAMHTRFNVQFNGTESFDEGISALNKANKDNYSEVLPMYAISHHENSNSATSQMNRTIEKARKAMKLHSITAKPKKNYKKRRDPKYQAYYNQKEFNPALKKAWLQLGQSEFYKGEFLGAVGTFNYIANHYATDPEMVALAQIWVVRAYAEKGWIYEAEDILDKIDQNDLTRKITPFFAAVNADLLMKKKKYTEAIPFLKLALKGEKKRYNRQRFNFILGQLLERKGNRKEAIDYYQDVINTNPPYNMAFNARINKAQLMSDNPKSAEKQLLRMVKNGNNKDYLDQIYGTIAKVYLQVKDTTTAINYFKKSIEKSTLNGVEKGESLVALADVYYARKDYVSAQPYYDEASKIYTKKYSDFERINQRAETLNLYATQYNVVHLQDSLQALTRMPEKERLKVIEKVIEEVKKQAKENAELTNKPNRNLNNDDFSMDMRNRIGAKANDWYFYNPSLVRKGKSEFRKTWGNRKLEDNWRRLNKSAQLFESDAVTDTTSSDLSNDSTSVASSANDSTTNDKTSVAYYLQQLPFSVEQRNQSNTEIADGLFQMGMIAKDRIEDFALSSTLFNEFETRFAMDKRVCDAIFQQFLMASKEESTTEAEGYRQQILNQCHNSEYAELLAQPNYIARTKKMIAEQDSVYQQTYWAYTKSHFQTVKRNVAYAREHYFMSKLLPKFELLNTLTIGKTAGAAPFKTALNNLVTKYPNSDVSAMSKDLLALIKQGNIAKKGTSHGSILTKRQAEIDTVATAVNTFSKDKKGKHRLVLMMKNTPDSTINNLLYQLALFNFSRFMIKDFDFETNRIAGNQALSITNLESYNEVIWYLKTLTKDTEITDLITQLKIQEIPISDTNYNKLMAGIELSEYLSFEEKFLSRPQEKKETKKEKKAPKVIEYAPEMPQKEEVEQPATTKEQTTTNTPKETQKTTKDTVANPQKEVVTTPKKEPKVVEEKKKEEIKYYNKLFAITPNAPHYIAIYIKAGNPDFDKIKKVFDTYNNENYGLLNIEVRNERFKKEQLIIIGTFPDAETAKSYLLRMVKERKLMDLFKGVSRRNLIGTQQNLNTMMQNDAMTTYFQFMREFYLK